MALPSRKSSYPVWLSRSVRAKNGTNIDPASSGAVIFGGLVLPVRLPQIDVGLSIDYYQLFVRFLNSIYRLALGHETSVRGPYYLTNMMYSHQSLNSVVAYCSVFAMTKLPSIRWSE